VRAEEAARDALGRWSQFDISRTVAMHPRKKPVVMKGLSCAKNGNELKVTWRDIARIQRSDRQSLDTEMMFDVWYYASRFVPPTLPTLVGRDITAMSNNTFNTLAGVIEGRVGMLDSFRLSMSLCSRRVSSPSRKPKLAPPVYAEAPIKAGFDAVVVCDKAGHCVWYIDTEALERLTL
jgi:hypothetical protein